MRLLVFGGTRGVGQHFAERALDMGHAVTLFARDASDVEGWPKPPTRVVEGDARDQAAVVAAVPGHDAVVVSLGPSGFERVQRFIGPATEWIVRTMEANGMRRLLLMSALGVGESRREAPGVFRWLVAPILLRATYEDRADAEAVVKRSALDWTIVRPLYLTDDPASGGVHATTDGREVRKRISRADVAAFLLDELARDTHVREAVAVEGAQAKS